MKCKEIDSELAYVQLPAHMIKRNFIIGEEDCNYEVYLRELINESITFRQFSGGQRFWGPPSEENRQPDAISDQYSLDFKLMISSSRMEANSLLTGSIEKMCEGAYCFGTSKKHGEMKSVNLCQALRYKDVQELERIAESKQHSLVEKDIKYFLNKLRTEKNILLFLPYIFYYVGERSEQASYEIVEL